MIAQLRAFLAGVILGAAVVAPMVAWFRDMIADYSLGDELEGPQDGNGETEGRAADVD